MLVINHRFLAVFASGNDRFGPLGFDGFAPDVAVVAPVRHHLLGFLAREQPIGLGHIAGLRGREFKGQGVAQAVAHRVDLRAAPAARGADGLLALAPGPGAVPVGFDAGAIQVEGLVISAEARAHGFPNPGPQAAVTPPLKAGTHAAPRPEGAWQITLGSARAMHPEDAFQASAAMFGRTSLGKKRLQLLPVCVGQNSAGHKNVSLPAPSQPLTALTAYTA